MGEPEQIEAGGSEVVIVDDETRVWRWRASDETGRGTLARLDFIGDTQWGTDHGDMETYTASNAYRIYVVEPSQGQILRYEQTLDRSAFTPSPYLITESDEVKNFRQLYIDFDLWALDEKGVQKYKNGRYEGGFMIADPPDASDLRPGHDYALVSGTGNDVGGGRLFLYDSVWDRLVVFDKATGDYLGQWAPGPDGPSMEDMRGFYVVPKTKQKPESVVWLTPEGLYRAELTIATTGDPVATAKPSKRDRRNRSGRDSG